MILNVLLLLNAFILVSAEPTFKDYYYLKDINAFYKYYTSKTFDDAVKICKYDDAELVVPESKYEFEQLTLRHYRFWIGANNRVDQKQYQSINGFDLSKLDMIWVNKHPTYDVDNCAFGVFSGMIKSAPCDYTIPFVCKKAWGNSSFTEIEKPIYRNGYLYVKLFNSYYKYYAKPTKFTEAVNTCFEDGATLLIPQSSDEAWFGNVYSQTIETWIGVHDIRIEGKFATIDGSDMMKVYMKWAGNHPRYSFDSINCVTSIDGKENKNVECTSEFSFVCKISPDKIKWDEECQTHVSNYLYNKESGHCYKYYSIKKRWEDAKNRCESENATLVVINNKSEEDFIKNIISAEPSSSVSAIHSGFQYIDENYVVIGNEVDLDKQIYKNWAPEYPKSDEEVLICGGLNREAQMMVHECNDKLSYICEKIIR